jgi:hypothetical protein
MTRRVDDTLDELMHACNNNLAVGAGRGLADMIEDGMRLIGVAGTEDCKHGRTDGSVAEDKDFIDELVLDSG